MGRVNGRKFRMFPTAINTMAAMSKIRRMVLECLNGKVAIYTKATIWKMKGMAMER